MCQLLVFLINIFANLAKRLATPAFRKGYLWMINLKQKYLLNKLLLIEMFPKTETLYGYPLIKGHKY